MAETSSSPDISLGKSMSLNEASCSFSFPLANTRLNINSQHLSNAKILSNGGIRIGSVSINPVKSRFSAFLIYREKSDR